MILSSSYSYLTLLLLSVVCTSHKYDLSAPSSICDDVACNCSQVVPDKTPIVVSCDFGSRDYTIDANSMPRNLEELTITAAEVVVFEARSFSRLALLTCILVRNVSALIVKRESFVNLSSLNLQLHIVNVERVEFESKSFYLLKGPISYVILECWSLTVHSDAMPWIQNLTIQDVKYVQLHENAFSRTEKLTHYQQSYSTKIVMQGVSMEELPKNAFPFSATEIKLVGCNIGVIRTNAFSALELNAVTILNSTFKILQTEAFSERSLMHTLQIINVKMEKIRPGAILSAVINFKIANCDIDVVELEAFNVSTMVSFHFINNVLGRLKPRAITIRGWTKAIIESNTLRQLESEAISVEASTKYPSYFHFTGNILDSLQKHSLKFNIHGQSELLLTENIFIKPCHCDWKSSLNDFVEASGFIIDSLYNESYCSINPQLAKCFNHPESFMRAINFTEQVCVSPDKIICQQQISSKNPNISKATGILNEKTNHERFLVAIIAALAFAGALLTALLSVCIRLKSSGKKGSRSLISSILSRLTFSRNINRVASASSIARVSIHQYSEVGPIKLLPNDAIEESIYICEDKATQTLPEELTQELLQALRDKLDDPQNYTEARNMIEHLYDLIKVEECCNNNVLNEKFGEINNEPTENENVYDVIKCDSSSTQRIRRYDKSFRTLANKGTRAPSPDKLSPISFTSSSFSNSNSSSSSLGKRRQAAFSVSEYMVPNDRRSDIYSELIYDRYRPPDVVLVAEYTEPRDYEVPVYSELSEVANRNRPLPITPKSTVVYGVNGDRELSIELSYDL